MLFWTKMPQFFFFLALMPEELADSHGYLHYRATGATLPAAMGVLPSPSSPPFILPAAMRRGLPTSSTLMGTNSPVTEAVCRDGVDELAGDRGGAIAEAKGEQVGLTLRWSRSRRRPSSSAPHLRRYRATRHCHFLVPEVEEVEARAFSSGMVFLAKMSFLRVVF